MFCFYVDLFHVVLISCFHQSDIIFDHFKLFLRCKRTQTPSRLVQNSWSDTWGSTACDDASNPHCKAKGFIKVKRAADGQAEKCGVDNDPADGSACDGETDPVTVCGECGIISDSSMATGVHVNSTAIGMF
jgi:hypothetical protein